MKQAFRSTVAFMLLLVLIFFSLWREEKLTAVAERIESAAKELETLIDATTGVISGEGGGNSSTATPTDRNGNYADYNPAAPIDADLEGMLREGITNMEESIDLSALSPTREEVRDAMVSILYSSPEFFYLSSAYSLSLSGDAVQAVIPGYTVAKDAVAPMRAEYLAVLDEIVAGAPADGTDFDKLLYLHDYFVANYTYDHSLTIRDAHTFFTQKTGVCQAYMLGLIAAAEALGIESLPVTSDAMKHAWNLVKLDGAWYHVDITWDDSSSLPSFTSYTYFLQSDTGLAAIDASRAENERHHDWVAAEPATDATYDNAAFREAKTPLVKHEGVYYCTLSATDGAATVRGMVVSGTDAITMTHFADIRGGYWSAGEGRYYTGCYAGLVLLDGYLYYNSGNSIARLDPDAPTAYRVYLVSGLADGESIYGFLAAADGKLTYVVAAAPNATAYKTAVYSVDE